jgi:hypothetical protein
MAEWLKAHAWKACLPQGNVGSNPTLSAILLNLEDLTHQTSGETQVSHNIATRGIQRFEMLLTGSEG